MKTQTANIQAIQIVAKALGELNDQAVFVGGSVIPFYLPEVYVSQARSTEDIDVVLKIIGQIAAVASDELLRKKGFNHDTSQGAPACRWIYRNLKIDVMSFDESAFGFTNEWYKEGVLNAIEILSKPVSVKILNLPYFLATKIVAFQQRGNSDYMGSRDMEDIISLIEVCTEDLFEKEFEKSSNNLQQFIKSEFKKLISNSDFIDAVPGAVFNRNMAQASSELVLARMEALVSTV